MKRWRTAGLSAGASTSVCSPISSHDHLNAHGSFEHYLASKAQLFVHLRRGSSAVLNANDQAASYIERVTPPYVRRLYFSAPSRGPRWAMPDLALRSCKLNRRGTLIELEPSELADALGRKLEIRLLGAAFAENALAAALAGYAVGLSPEQLKAGLLSLDRVPGRFELVVDSPCVAVDYAHSEDALRRTCQAGRALLGEIGGGKLVVVFGAGGERDAEKRVPMGRAVGESADLAIVTNDNPRGEEPSLIAQALLRGVHAGGRARGVVELDRRRAIERALDAAGRNDVVLVCGKGHESEQVGAALREHFDDAECVRSLIAS
ncbi:MAG: cyanophycin synthetase [Polyangiaceae bacterium]